MATQIKEISEKKGVPRSSVIKHRNGEILKNIKQVLERQRVYVEELYAGQRGNQPDLGDIEPGPPNLKREVVNVISSQKQRKAECSDGIVAEMIEAAGEFG